MQLTQVKFRNINSYGNRWQTINFDPNNPGLYQICGENGTGKSTISQVLKLGLYGKVQGKKTKAQCVNRINKSGEVVITFETRLGKVDVHRGLLPDSFTLKVGGSEYKQAGIKNVQEYLEENLIGIPQKIFNNSVSLSINDFKSFLKMSAEDKREIVDKIFGLESLNKMRKLLNEETKEIKSFLSKCEDKIRLIEDSITTAKNELLVVEEKLKDDNSEKIESLNKQYEELHSLKNPIEEKKLKASEAKEKLEKLERKISSEKQGIRANLDNLSRQKKLYESDKCPTCGSSLDSEDHKHKYQDILNEEEGYKQRLQELSQKSEEVNERMKKAKNALLECNNRILDIQSKVRSVQSMIKEAESQKINQQTDGIQRIIEQNLSKLENLQEERTKLMKEHSIYKIVDEILGEKGLKKSVMEHIVKPMNNQVNSILSQLELPFKVEFDGHFEAKLKQLSYEISTEELSTGQLKMLDFAVLLAIIKMLKIKFPTLNILFLDEIFSSLDPNNISRIVHILRKIAKDYNMNIMVINHAPLPTELFDWTISTSIKDNFSNLVVEKCI
jgi:DNA repair exonuclease SbcCD ATPase subunit